MDYSFITPLIYENLLFGLKLVWDSAKACPWLYIIAALALFTPKRKKRR